MALNSQGYFNSLRSYLNMAYYAVNQANDAIVLKEKIYVPGSTKKKEIKVSLSFKGEAFGIKLDKKNDKGNSYPLFHFLDDNGKPWSKRCDFVIFQHYNRKIQVYCIEFKYETLSVESIINQLNASVCWCQSLHSTIKNYTTKKKKLNLTKFVFSFHPDPDKYLDDAGKYLQRDYSIRHYSYDDVNGMNLEDLENSNVEEIR